MVINELMYSIEGEGFYEGIPTIFVRLSGCSIKCKYCDTPKAISPKSGTDLPVGKIEGEIRKIHESTGIKRVSITGGNPMESDLGELKKLLFNIRGFSINIEHPGIFLNYEEEVEVFRCLSYPKDSVSFDIKTPCAGKISRVDEFKSLYDFKNSFNIILKAVIMDIRDIKFLEIFMASIYDIYKSFIIQPCEIGGSFAKLELDDLIPLLVKYEGRLLPQIHKCLGLQ